MSSMNQESPAKTTLWRAADDALSGQDRSVATPTGPADPIGSGDNAGEIDRRSFMKLMGASMGLAGLTSCRRPVQTIVPYSTQPPEYVPGKPVYFATTLTRDGEAVGVLVESHEGRPTKIEPNPSHPGSAGGVSSFELASILTLADPDRPRDVTYTGGDSTWDAFLEDWRAHPVAPNGLGLAVLVDPYHSAAIQAEMVKLKAKYPAAITAAWAPVSDSNIHDGQKAAMGKAVRGVPDLTDAKVILALDSDFLHLETDAVRHTKAFADGRRVHGRKDAMNRLYVAEHSFSVTGGMADHRVRVRRSDIPAVVAALARRLAAPKSGDGFTPKRIPGLAAIPELPLPAGVTDTWIGAVAADLAQAGKHSVVLAGRGQSASVHAVIAALNDALGNAAQDGTLSYVEAPDARDSSLTELTGLVTAMNSGAITTLVIVGPNPVLTAPADLKFAEALEKIEHSVHLSHYYDETSEFCKWHLPRSLELECWGTPRTTDGTIGITQPLIAPLHHSISELEALSLLLGNAESGYELCRATVGKNDAAWKSILHNGVAEGTKYGDPYASINETSLTAQLKRQTLTAGPDFEIALAASPTLYDGRFANNGWMQELPSPVTKLVWDNAAIVSPATARDLGVSQEDLVTVTTAGTTLTLPVFVLPGHSDKSVSVDLGFGRNLGAVAEGAGVNAYPLATSAAYSGGKAKVTKTSGTYPLSTTQKHHNMDGNELVKKISGDRPLILEADLLNFAEKGESALTPPVHNPTVGALWKEHEYTEGNQWGMAIDLNVCTGCNACVTACQSENNIPVVGKENAGYGRELHWIRTDRYFKGDEDDPELRVQPVPCMHCEMAPCEQVCPVGATSHTKDGLNAMTYNRCIGTRYCANNCPYKVRRFNFFNFTKNGPETNVRGETAETTTQKLSQNPDVTVRFRGVMEKCTYCVQRISQARISAKVDGRALKDGDVTTACQQACPAGAIAFGDINDKTSHVSAWKANERNYALLPELLTRPRTTYMARLRNPNPRLNG